MPEELRPRRPTVPPLPPSGDRERLILLEHQVADMRDDLRAMRQDFGSMSENLLVLVTQKEDAEKAAAKEHHALEKWKTAGITVLVTAFLGIAGVLAKIALVMQSAKVLPPP